MRSPALRISFELSFILTNLDCRVWQSCRWRQRSCRLWLSIAGPRPYVPLQVRRYSVSTFTVRSAVCVLSGRPVFGLELFGARAREKSVLNGAIDMVGNERGNMRCFEAMGCGALLLSDEGKYPDGMVPERTLITYTSAADAIA